MTEVMDSRRLIELVIEKHRRFLETFNSEFSEINSRLSAIKQQADTIKKEIETTDSRIQVFNEKYHLLFYQAKKQREEVFSAAVEKVRAARATNLQEAIRLGSRIEEFEKRLQKNSKNIDEEESIIVEIKKLLYEFESAARGAGINIACKGIVDKLNDANSSHKELLNLQNKPKEHAAAAREYNKQIGNLEGRYNWLKHRIDSHNTALGYWEKQKGGMKID